MISAIALFAMWQWFLQDWNALSAGLNHPDLVRPGVAAYAWLTLIGYLFLFFAFTGEVNPEKSTRAETILCCLSMLFLLPGAITYNNAIRMTFVGEIMSELHGPWLPGLEVFNCAILAPVAVGAIALAARVSSVNKRSATLGSALLIVCVGIIPLVTTYLTDHVKFLR